MSLILLCGSISRMLRYCMGYCFPWHQSPGEGHIIRLVNREVLHSNTLSGSSIKMVFT
jgi:hypothetical protein